jgi:hypothetical protein
LFACFGFDNFHGEMLTCAGDVLLLIEMPGDLGVIAASDRYILVAEATSILMETFLLGIGRSSY